MIFCGQCGLQLPSGATKCPRCGTVIEADNSTTEWPSDDPTVASVAYTMQNNPPSPYPQQPPQAPPQRLVLPGGAESANSSYTQQGFDARTRAGNPPTYSTVMQPATPQPGYTQGGYQTANAYPQHYQEQHQRPHKGRTTGLIFILFGLLLILSAMVLLALQHNGIIAGGGGGNGGSGLTASQTMEQYYRNINQHNYQAAYALWQNSSQTLADFQNGFKNTQHDSLAVDDTAPQSDGTVKLTVTVTATENAAAGSKTAVYKGSYIMSKQSDGSWKILQGNLHTV